MFKSGDSWSRYGTYWYSGFFTFSWVVLASRRITKDMMGFQRVLGSRDIFFLTVWYETRQLTGPRSFATSGFLLLGGCYGRVRYDLNTLTSREEKKQNNRMNQFL